MRYDFPYRKSYKKKEEIVACHLKEEESINPSLDQDPDQDTDQLHTIEKDQSGIKEGQDPKGLRDGQGHCHVQYLPRRHSKVRSKTRSPRNNRCSRSLSHSISPRRHSKTRSRTPIKHQKRRSQSPSPSQKCTKVKGGANRHSKSRSNSPYHDHRTPRERFPMDHDNAEWTKMLNKPKHLSVLERRHSKSRSRS